MQAIREGQRQANLEEGSVRLMTMAEAQRDQIRAERQQRRQGLKLGIANAVGVTVGIAAGVLGGPAAGAAAGGAVTMGGRRLAQKNWQGRVEGLTFAASRDALRKSVRPDITKDLAVSVNNAATGYQAGQLANARAEKIGSEFIDNATGDANQQAILSMARPGDVQRNGMFGKFKFTDTAARNRLKAKYVAEKRTIPDWLSEDSVTSFELGLRDIIKGRR